MQRRDLGTAKAMLVVLTTGVWIAGCNPATTAVKIGAQMVGKVIVNEQTAQLGQQLIGRSPAVADAKLGARQDTLKELNGRREWLIYPVKGDVLGRRRHVVEVSRDRITSVKMVEASGSKVDIPRKIYYQEKLKGKSPRECQAILKMGSPLIAARSVQTGQLRQMYDARMVEGMGGMKYCVVKYANQRCFEVNLIEVAASD